MITTRYSRTAVGLAAGVLGGLTWGLAFVLPLLLDGWSPAAITAGRYLAYGLVSLVIFLVSGPAVRRIARDHWRPALVYAAAGNVGYYLLLVIGVQTVGAPVTDMVIGCIPLTLALAANWISRTYRWSRLVTPVILVTSGLVVINVLELGGAAEEAHSSATTKALGLLAVFAAVAVWTWYGLHNARFLGDHPEVSSGSWSTVVGVVTGAVTLAGLPLAAATGQLRVAPDAEAGVADLVLVSLALGVLVSWVGTWLWNAASSMLPTTLAGMLINLETVSGYAYVYAYRGEWPPLGQVAGFALILAGVVLVIRRQRPPAEQARSGAPAGGRRLDLSTDG
jgi:drug/metabolite transporter (DMT)-like permease